MDTIIIEKVYNELQERLARGDEAAALVYLRDNFEKLPEEIQAEILTRAYLSAMQQEIESAQVRAEIQQKTISLIKVLEVLKQQIEKEATN